MSKDSARLIRRRGNISVWASDLGHEVVAFDPTLPESYYDQACQQLLDTLSEQVARARRGSGQPPSWWDPTKNHSFYEFEILGIVGVPDVGVVLFFSLDSEPDARYLYLADTTRLDDLAQMDPENPYLHQYSHYYGVGSAFDIFEETSLARLAEEDWSTKAVTVAHDNIIRIIREKAPE